MSARVPRATAAWPTPPAARPITAKPVDVRSGPLPKECDEPELAHLPRLVVDFNKRDFARLRQLIDAINRL